MARAPGFQGIRFIDQTDDQTDDHGDNLRVETPVNWTEDAVAFVSVNDAPGMYLTAPQVERLIVFLGDQLAKAPLLPATGAAPWEEYDD